MEKLKRGFALLDAERRRAAASLGGILAHRKGTAYEWTREQARAAGQKGGRARAEALRARKAAEGQGQTTI